MTNLQELENTMPVAPLKIVALPSAKKLGARVNDYLAEFRRSIHNDKVKTDPAFQGYAESSYLVGIDTPPIAAHEFLGDNIDSKDVIIIDDLISSGQSMLDTARQLKRMNARRVFLCSTFGLFTQGLEAFDKAYEMGFFDKLVTTDLIYLPPKLYDRPYFIEADMSKFIASLINFMNHDASLNNALTATDKIHSILESYNNRLEFEMT